MTRTIITLFQMVFMLLLCLPASAQLSKGTTALGAQLKFNLNFGVYTSDPENDLESNLVILPSLGFFVSDKTALGFGIGYKSIKNQSIRLIIENENSNSAHISEVRAKSSLFVFSTFVQRYFPLKDRMGLILDIQANIETGKMSYTINSGSLEENVVNVELIPAPRFYFMLSEQLGLEVGYQPLRIIGSSFNDRFDLSGNFDPHGSIGLRYYLN